MRWFIFIILAMLISVPFTYAADTIAQATLVPANESVQGGGGAPPLLSIADLQATFTAAQIASINSELAYLLSIYGDNIPQSELIKLQEKLKSQGVDLTLEQINTWQNSLPQINIIQGTVGGGGFPTDEDPQCNIQVQPTSVELTVDKIAAQITITNLHTESISPTFGLYPLEGKNNAIPYLALRGDVAQILPNDKTNVVVYTYPGSIVNLTENYEANMRIILEGCRDVDVPIVIRTGSLFPFLNMGFLGGIVGFFGYFADILNKVAFTIGGFKVKYSILSSLIFIVIFISLKSSRKVTWIGSMILGLILSAIITLGIFTLIGGS